MIYVIQVRRQMMMPNRKMEYVWLFSAEIDEPPKAVGQLFDLFECKFPKPEYEINLFHKVTKLEAIHPWTLKT
jgi:hypothetical protein